MTPSTQPSAGRTITRNWWTRMATALAILAIAHISPLSIICTWPVLMHALFYPTIRPKG